MVKVVYNSRRRIEVNDNITIGKAIEMVADSSELEHCHVFFNDERLSNETVISSIPGIKSDHTLRVVCSNKGVAPSLGSNTPTVNQFIQAYTRMNEKDNKLLIGFVEGPEFKQKILSKFPALASDGQALSILSDHVLAYEYIERNEEKFFEDHPLFLPVLYAIFDSALNQDVMNRLFSNIFPGGNTDNLHSMLNFLPTPSSSTTVGSNNRARSSHNLFTAEMFNSALQMVETGRSFSSASTQRLPTAPQPAPVLDNPLQVYESQLSQLHEYGFLNDDENVLALVEAEGNIELALEFIIRNREAMDLD